MTMRRLLIVLALICIPLTSFAFPDGTLRLVYRETQGEKSAEREYLVQHTPRGLELQVTFFSEQPVMRKILAGPDYDTYQEFYEELAGPGRVEVNRKGDTISLSGQAGNKDISLCETVDDTDWYGSVLLLKDFVLSGQESRLFYVTKPEDERLVKLKAIREAEESVTVNGHPMDTVRVRFTMPDFRSMFWSSTYWFRASDGLFVKSDETRGGPGSPKVQVELVSEELLGSTSPLSGAPGS